MLVSIAYANVELNIIKINRAYFETVDIFVFKYIKIVNKGEMENVLNERIYDINTERSDMNLSESDKEGLYRAINELKKLKECD